MSAKDPLRSQEHVQLLDSLLTLEKERLRVHANTQELRRVCHHFSAEKLKELLDRSTISAIRSHSQPSPEVHVVYDLSISR